MFNRVLNAVDVFCRRRFWVGYQYVITNQNHSLEGRWEVAYKGWFLSHIYWRIIHQKRRNLALVSFQTCLSSVYFLMNILAMKVNEDRSCQATELTKNTLMTSALFWSFMITLCEEQTDIFVVIHWKRSLLIVWLNWTSVWFVEWIIHIGFAN